MAYPPRIFVPGGRPKHQKQLVIPHPFASQNCGPTAELVGLEHASRNDFRPRRRRAANWITAERKPMPHGAGWPATTLQAIEISVNSSIIAHRFRERGVKPPSGRMVRITHNEAVELLKMGRALHVAVDYGRLNDLMPKLSGSRSYRGGHAIELVGYAEGREHGHRVDWTYEYDPLHDGRAPGVPRGLQKVRIKRFLRAAETWGIPRAGAGNAYVVIIKKGT